MTSRSVSVTGATGFLGWHLSEAFRDAGWAVRAIVRPGNRKPLPDRVEVVEAPLEYPALSAALGRSEVLVHSAALVRAASAEEINRVNVDGTRAAVDAANAAGTRLVLISSQAAHGPSSPPVASTEDDAPHPLTAYGRSKLAAEAVVRTRASVPWTIVRPSAVYGPRDVGFLPLFRLASRGIFPLAAPAAMPFTFIHADDVVRAIVKAAADDRAVGQTFFLGHPDPQTAGDLMRGLAQAFGRAYRPLALPASFMRIAGLVGDACWKMGVRPTLDSSRTAEMRAAGFVCSVDRVQDVMGFRASIPLREGLTATARWYRERRWV